MASLLFGSSKKPSLSNKHSDAARSISVMDELDKEDTSTKSPAQLERILYEYERNLAALLRTLSPGEHAAFVNAYTASEKAYVSKKAEGFMARAESVKAILRVKKDQRAAQTEQLRLQEVRAERRRSSVEDQEAARRLALQEETRRRLSEARLEDQRRRNSSGGDGTLPSSSARRRSFDGVAAAKIAGRGARRASPTNAHPAANASRRTSPPPTKPLRSARPAGGSYTAAAARRSSHAGGIGGGAKKYSELEQSIVDEVKMDPPTTSWDDIVGLQDAKTALQETVILPTLRPDIFVGLRAPPKGVLLFGPPGTGKTMIARACASESGFDFFAVSASSLTSKWVGEGEKMVRALFKVAQDHAPAVVFMDEIDSVLSKRKANEHEASRRLKTEFLVQIDGVNSSDNDPANNVLVIGATNLPSELDDAVIRRFGRRVYVPLPDESSRRQIFVDLLGKNRHSLGERDLLRLVAQTADFSPSDIKNLCQTASMGPLRSISMRSLAQIDPSKIPPITFQHFADALKGCKPSVSAELLKSYETYLTKS